MKNRSFFVAGALLLASLFTTSCKELMSNLDEPVSSYLSAPADITVPTGDTYDLSKVVTTINSDETITYESSDPNIATVDKTTGLVTGLTDGEAEITASIKGNDYYLAGEQKIKVAVKRPLTFEALEDGSIRVVLNNYINLPKPIVYTIINKDGKETKTITADGTMSTSLSIAVSKGDKVEFESANDHTAVYEYDANYDYYTRRFVRIYPSNCKCAVYGNVMSMITPDGNYHTNKTITQDYALYYLLGGSYTNYDKDGDGIYETREYHTLSHDKYKLLLPATKLSDYCYYNMLRYTGLTDIPELPAEELAPYCYYYMFADCWNLTKISSLPAKKLAIDCYARMFYNCKAMKKAPELPAEELADYCYSYMFAGCSELTETPAINVKSLGNYACQYMFQDCTNLKKANAITVENEAGNYAFRGMFRNCGNLTESPAITAESLGEYACQNMFYNSQKLEKVNAINVKTVGNYAFQNLFANQPELTDVVAVNAETMGEWACYYMFNNCPKLKNVPATLPATTLANSCYSDMFAGCTSLKKAPALPATTLANSCYNYMFGGCSALTEAPELKAATLVDHCYCAMFMNCSKLSKVTCLATTNAPDALGIWLAGAGTDASVTTRTLVRAEANTNWTNNDSWDWPSTNWYVPTGWTIDPAIPE